MMHFCYFRYFKFFLILLLFLGFPLSFAKTIKIADSDIQFELYTVDKKANGPAFAEMADMNNNGKLDLVITHFGKGFFYQPYSEVSVYLQGKDISEWKKVPIVTRKDKIIFPNHPTLVDLNNNGKVDMILPYGFLVCEVIPFGKPCGGLAVFMQKSINHFERYDIVPPGDDLFYHEAILHDLTNNGIKDLITVAERKGFSNGKGEDVSKVLLFKGIKNPPYFSKEPILLAEGLGGLPQLYDVNNNGKMDLVSAEYFYNKGASFTWLEQVSSISASNPSGVWKRHIIDDTSGPSIQFQMVDNLFGDGVPYGIGSNHSNTSKKNPDPWESALYLFYPGTDITRPWNKVKISEGIASRVGSSMKKQLAPGIFGYGNLDGDGDGDGDIDFLVSGDGDDRVFFIEQTGFMKFKTHVLLEKFGQAGAMVVKDIDGDGISEGIISSYEKDTIYLLKNSKIKNNKE